MSGQVLEQQDLEHQHRSMEERLVRSERSASCFGLLSGGDSCISRDLGGFEAFAVSSRWCEGLDSGSAGRSGDPEA